MSTKILLTLLYNILQPQNLPTLLKLYHWKQSRRDITSAKDSDVSGWCFKDMRRCWEFLDMTSSTFASVTKQLEGDMGKIVCIFYLVLRALDTVEDDMTLSIEFKLPLLRSFHEKIVQQGWDFDGSGPNEKDRQLLVEFDVVVDELRSLSQEYQEVIIETCRIMEEGMADYCLKASASSVSIEAADDLDSYCHFVAGVVGQGLTRLFAINGIESHWLSDQMTLANSWGLFLQKVNILRDFREDVDDSRCFWPRQIWNKRGFREAKDMIDPSREEQALWVSSEMVVEVLHHATDMLDYLSFLQNPSVFEFVAIPAIMAMLTLRMCFMNRDLFHKNIKPSKMEAMKVIVDLKSVGDAASVFASCSKQIRSCAVPSDPSYQCLCDATKKVENWYLHRYPPFATRWLPF